MLRRSARRLMLRPGLRLGFEDRHRHDVAGAGSKPYEISGDLFLAERKGTDVAGAVIVVDAQVGDLDLGKVIVPGRILLRPTDAAGLDFISDVPLRVEGVGAAAAEGAGRSGPPELCAEPVRVRAFGGQR